MFADDDRRSLAQPTQQQIAETALKTAFDQAAQAIANDIVRRGLSQTLTYAFAPNKQDFATNQTEDAAWHTWLLDQGASHTKAYAVMFAAVKLANNELAAIYPSGTRVSRPQEGGHKVTFMPKPVQ